MAQSTTERVADTAITVVSRLAGQLDQAFGELQEIAPQGSGMTFKHPQDLDKSDHFVVLQRQGDTWKQLGVYPGKYASDAVQAAGKSGQSQSGGDLLCISTRSIWQPEA